MRDFEVTTPLDVATTWDVVTTALLRRGFTVDWENAWSGEARKGLSRVELVVFAPKGGLTVVRVQADSADWVILGGMLGWLWIGRFTNRTTDAIVAALNEREAALGVE